jgi:hypothetical protein
VTLSTQQLKALRYTAGRHLYAEILNEGNGNLRRSILSLFKIALLGWDPLYNGRVIVTEAGRRALAVAQDIERANKAKIGVMDKTKRREFADQEQTAKKELRRIVKDAKTAREVP